MAAVWWYRTSGLLAGEVKRGGRPCWRGQNLRREVFDNHADSGSARLPQGPADGNASTMAVGQFLQAAALSHRSACISFHRFFRSQNGDRACIDRIFSSSKKRSMFNARHLFCTVTVPDQHHELRRTHMNAHCGLQNVSKVEWCMFIS